MTFSATTTTMHAMMNRPTFTTIKVNDFTYITNEPCPGHGFSRNPASPWFRPASSGNGSYRIFKKSKVDIGKIYCYCSKCFQWMLEGVGDVPPHTKKFCKAAHGNPNTFSLPADHPYMVKKMTMDNLEALFRDGISIEAPILQVVNNSASHGLGANPVAGSFSSHSSTALLSDPLTHVFARASATEYDITTLASVARSSSSLAAAKSSTRIKTNNVNKYTPKIKSNNSFLVFDEDVDGTAYRDHDTKHDQALGSFSRPRRCSAPVEPYTDLSMLTKKQGTKRIRVMPENINTNTNRDYDDDSIGSESTQENEF